MSVLSHRTAFMWIVFFLAAGCSSAAADREKVDASGKNASKICVAIQNYCNANQGRFPTQAIKIANDKPGLSWRVVILPYLGEEKLYREFKLDEPWDSEHNTKLIKRMPDVYKSPLGVGQEGFTNYLGLISNDSILGSASPVKTYLIKDGTANIPLFVEANNDKAVEWTKPADLAIDGMKPDANLGELIPQGAFITGLASGDVILLSNKIDLETLHKLCTYKGGEVIDWQRFKFGEK